MVLGVELTWRHSDDIILEALVGRRSETMNAKFKFDVTHVGASAQPSEQLAAVLSAPMRTRLASTLATEPRAGEVRVRLEGCGVCASNLAVWEGRPWFEYPREAGSPGHEGWGIVDAIGDDVVDVEVGTRVAMISSHAYAQFDVASADAIVPLPHVLDEHVFPGEPLGCAMNIFERAGIESHHRVAIIGAGFLGVLLTQLASRAGAAVVVLSRRQYALDFARRMGALETFSTKNPRDARERALTASGGNGYDRVIEAVGRQEALDIATALAAEYGRLVIAGYHQDGPRQIDVQQWNWRALDVINAHERSISRYVNGVKRAVDAVVSGQFDPFPLLTHELPLERLDDAFELTRSRPPGFMKALVRMGLRA
jgi:threonine dehydrogenase-like Zn-dependent dehydrogenase